MSLLSRRSYAYTKMDMEDPDEIKHRRAQFLIHKNLQKADSFRKKQPWLRLKLFKLKIKMGKKIKKLRVLRKGISSTITSAKVDFCKQICCQIGNWKRLLHGQEAVLSLNPVFS